MSSVLDKLINETDRQLELVPNEDLPSKDRPILEHHNPLDIAFGKELPNSETVSVPGSLSGISIGAKKKQETICPCELDKHIMKQVLDSKWH